MEPPLDQEAANADLISDVIPPSLMEPPDVCGMARDLAAGSTAWREAWAVGRYAEDPSHDAFLTTPPLSYAEDDELRGLNRLAEVGPLAGAKAERLIELRLRDRRDEVRELREVSEQNQRSVAAKASPRFFGRQRR